MYMVGRLFRNSSDREHLFSVFKIKYPYYYQLKQLREKVVERELVVIQDYFLFDGLQIVYRSKRLIKYIFVIMEG